MNQLKHLKKKEKIKRKYQDELPPRKIEKGGGGWYTVLSLSLRPPPFPIDFGILPWLLDLPLNCLPNVEYLLKLLLIYSYNINEHAFSPSRPNVRSFDQCFDLWTNLLKWLCSVNAMANPMTEWYISYIAKKSALLLSIKLRSNWSLQINPVKDRLFHIKISMKQTSALYVKWLPDEQQQIDVNH